MPAIVRKIAKTLGIKRPMPPAVRAVLENKLTYLEVDALKNLHQQVTQLEKDGVQGALIEAGCALGGSAIVMAHAKSKTRPFYVYDVFGQIPPPSEKDDADVHERYEVIQKGEAEGLAGQAYYGYEENLMEKVTSNFASQGVPVEANNIHLVKGLFEDTIHLNEPVALAHLDGDWYDSVMVCLERIAPHLSQGGVLVIDDYEHWSGCRKAVDDYFVDKKADFDFQLSSRLHIVRR